MITDNLIYEHSNFIDCFEPLKREYPMLTFTNIPSKGKNVPNGDPDRIYIIPKSDLGRDNSIQIHRLKKYGTIKFYMKRELMTDEEYATSLRENKRTSENRGRVLRRFAYERELHDFLRPKLDILVKRIDMPVF